MAAQDDFARERLYDPEAIRVRIRQERLRRKLEIKEFAALCGLKHWSLYKKDGGHVDYQTSDFISIGKALDAPMMWPLLDWDVADSVDRKIFGKNGK